MCKLNVDGGTTSAAQDRPRIHSKQDKEVPSEREVRYLTIASVNGKYQLGSNSK